MKIYNQKHDAIICFFPSMKSLEKGESPINGNEYPHKNKVQGIEKTVAFDEGKYIKVWFERDAILELASQINEIETPEFMEEYSDLPF